MIILSVFGEIEEIILSEKLGIGIKNLDHDWCESIMDDFKEEILIRTHDIAISEKSGFSDVNIKQYDLAQILKKAKWNSYETDIDIDTSMRLVSHRLIQLEVIEFDKSLLKLKNCYMDSPTCEDQYPKKFMKFCNTLLDSQKYKSQSNCYLPLIIYDSNEMSTKPMILNYLSAIVGMSTNIDEHTRKMIDALKTCGTIIDNFLKNEEDFWIFDYIVNSLNDNIYNSYYIFKIVSLFEMLLIKPDNKEKIHGELEKKLIRFIKQDSVIYSDSYYFGSLIRRLRNKIGHGDYVGFQKLLTEYRRRFMKEFYFDEYEFSIETWIINSICIELDIILSEIIYQYFTEKDTFLLFKNT